jgi:DNA-binding CsgD family transcriptional regulator
VEKPDLSLVLGPIHQHQFSPRGWRAVENLALPIGNSAAFLLVDANASEAPSEPDVRSAFLAAPDGASFLRSGDSFVLKHMRAGRSAGIVVRAEAGRGLDDAWMQFLAALAPHLQLALTTAFDLGDLQDRLVVDVLDSLGLPGASLDRHGTVVASNALFRDARLPWDSRDGQSFTLSDTRAQAQFGQLLSTDAATTRSILLRASRADAATSLHFLPLPDSGRAGFPRSTTLLIASPAEAPSAEMIRAVLVLSPGEAQLARSILAGQSIDDIAAASGRSIHTVRNQLKAVLTKTGTRSQTHLATLIARLVPLRQPSGR